MSKYIADVSHWPAAAIANSRGYAHEFQLVGMLDHHQSDRGHKCEDCKQDWPCSHHKACSELGARLAHRAQTGRSIEEEAIERDSV